MDDRFAIRSAFQDMPPGLQVVPDGDVVVDLPVENKPYAAVLITHGLASRGGQVYDTESSVPQAQVSVNKDIFIVRTPITKRATHLFEKVLTRSGAAQIPFAADTAHDFPIIASIPGMSRKPEISPIVENHL
jgi:hypothetical protein